MPGISTSKKRCKGPPDREPQLNLRECPVDRCECTSAAIGACRLSSASEGIIFAVHVGNSAMETAATCEGIGSNARAVTMVYYRLYRMDPFNGHITGFEEFEAPADADAVATAELQRSTVPMELWCGGRKLKRWDCPALAPGISGSRSAPS